MNKCGNRSVCTDFVPEMQRAVEGTCLDSFDFGRCALSSARIIVALGSAAYPLMLVAQLK